MKLKQIRNENFYNNILPAIVGLLEKQGLTMISYTQYHYRVFNSKRDKFDFYNSTSQGEIIKGIKRLKEIEKFGDKPQVEEKLIPVKDEALLDKILGKRG